MHALISLNIVHYSSVNKFSNLQDGSYGDKGGGIAHWGHKIRTQKQYERRNNLFS